MQPADTKPRQSAQPRLRALKLPGLVLGCLLAASVGLDVHAGPLMDRIRELRQARTQQTPGADDTGASVAELQADDAPNASPGHLQLPADTRLLRNLAYGPDPRQRLDVYVPGNTAAVGVVFMVHGGAWRLGSKSAGPVVANKVQRWLPKGLALISMDYRLLPDTPVASQAEDVRSALAWAQQQAPAWGLPADRFVLMGHSAGAHLVALLSANPAWAWSAGVQPWLGTVVLDSAALDVPTLMKRPHARLYDAAFGNDPSVWTLLSPAHRLTPQALPMQLVCSTKRADDACGQAQAFAQQATAHGTRAEVQPQARTHAEINADLGMHSPYTQAVESFLASLHPQLRLALQPH